MYTNRHKVENKEKYYHRAFDRDQADTLSAVNIDKSGVLNDVTGCHTLKLSGNELGITTNDGTIDKTIVVCAVQTVGLQITGYSSVSMNRLRRQ